MEKFEFKGETYNIIEDHTDSKEFQYKVTDTTRVRNFYAWYPVLVNKTFRWFKRIKVQDVLHISRNSSFDDGWTYSYHWNPWYSSWYVQKII